MNPAPSPFKELLAGATQGPWDSDTDDLGSWVNTPQHPAPIAKMGKCTQFNARQNAAYIARCNPAVMAVVWEALEGARQTMFEKHNGCYPLPHGPTKKDSLKMDTINRAIALLNGTGEEEKK